MPTCRPTVPRGSDTSGTSRDDPSGVAERSRSTRSTGSTGVGAEPQGRGGGHGDVSGPVQPCRPATSRPSTSPRSSRLPIFDATTVIGVSTTRRARPPRRLATSISAPPTPSAPSRGSFPTLTDERHGEQPRLRLRDVSRRGARCLGRRPPVSRSRSAAQPFADGLFLTNRGARVRGLDEQRGGDRRCPGPDRADRAGPGDHQGGRGDVDNPQCDPDGEPLRLQRTGHVGLSGQSGTIDLDRAWPRRPSPGAVSEDRRGGPGDLRRRRPEHRLGPQRGVST